MKNTKKKIRIIGIGLPKTGTTSLGDALKILGYKVRHHPVQYHNRILKNGDYTFPDAYDAIVNTAEDFYPLLYEMYPKSKFILTSREVSRWLKSWSRKDKPFRDQSETGYLDRIRVFGTCRFVENKFIDVHSRHFTNAQKFFADKESQFLTLHLEDKNKWKLLCGFLGKSVPSVPYPHSRRSK